MNHFGFLSYKDKGHHYFDKIWRDSKIMTRNEAYKWLTVRMGLSDDEAHFSRFNKAECNEAISHCKNLLDINEMKIRLALEDQFQFMRVNCEVCGIWWSKTIISAYDIVNQSTGVIQKVKSDKIYEHIKAGRIILK